jgi:hypothetical protein
MNNRMRLLLIGLGALVVIATFTYPVWRPLIVDPVAEDRFPGLSAEEQEAFAALPANQQAAFDALMATADATMVVAIAQAALQPDQVVPTAEQAMPQMTDPTVIRTGTFTEIDPVFRGEGTATMYQLADGSRILRFEEFRVTNGPNLHVLLTRRPAPRTAEEVGTDYIELGALKGNVGDQNYAVPSEVDLGQYRGVVIYSIPFEVVFSTAELR